MLGLILDIFALVVLMRVITGNEEDGFAKPAIIALVASIALFAASFAILEVGAGTTAILISLATLGGVGLWVALGCMFLMSIDPIKSFIIAAIFVVYKIAISFAFSAVLG